MIAEGRKLIALLDRRQELLNLVKQAEAYATRQKEINGLVGELSSRVRVAAVLRRQGVGDVVDRERAGLILSLVGQIRSGFQQAPESVIAPHSIGRLKQLLTAFNKDLDEKTRSLWRQYVGAEVPAADEELLKILSRLPGFGEAVRAINAATYRVEQILDTPPHSDAQFRDYDARMRKVKAAWNKIETAQIPVSVRSFLKDSIDRGAPLDRLTDDVREWLRENGLHGFFRIRFSHIERM